MSLPDDYPMEIEEGQQGCQVTTPSAENITTQMEGNHYRQHAYEEQYLEMDGWHSSHANKKYPSKSKKIPPI